MSNEKEKSVLQSPVTGKSPTAVQSPGSRAAVTQITPSEVDTAIPLQAASVTPNNEVRQRKGKTGKKDKSATTEDVDPDDPALAPSRVPNMIHAGISPRAVSPDYGKKSSYNKNPNSEGDSQELKWGLKRKFVPERVHKRPGAIGRCCDKAAPLLKAALILQLFAIFVVIAAIIMTERVVKFPWNGNSKAHSFDTFAIGSTSAYCSELTRWRIIEGHSASYASLFYMMCLAVVDPSRAGHGASSVLINLKLDQTGKTPPKCQYLDGFTTDVFNTTPVNEARRGNCMAEVVGVYTSATPGEHRIIAQLIDDITETGELKEFETYFDPGFIGRELKNFFVGSSLEFGLKKTQTQHVFYDSRRWMFDRFEEHMVAQRGAMIKNRFEFEDLKKLYTQKHATNDDIYKDLGKLFTNGKHMDQNLDEQYGNDSKGWKNGSVNAFQEEEVCYHAKESAASAFLSEDFLSREFVDERLDYYIKPDTYKRILEHSIDVLKTFAKNVGELVMDQLDRTERDECRDMFTASYKWNSNQFILFDKRDVNVTNVVVIVTTLGSQFGCIDEYAPNSELKAKFFLNNVLVDVDARDIKKTVLTNLHPFVAYNKKTRMVDLAYAGEGGYMTRSLSIPRMVTTAVLKFVFGIEAVAALRAPLLYELKGKARFSHDLDPEIMLKLADRIDLPFIKDERIEKLVAVEEYEEGGKRKIRTLYHGQESDGVMPVGI